MLFSHGRRMHTVAALRAALGCSLAALLFLLLHPRPVLAQAWVIETVDSLYPTGAYTSLELDAAGNPAISYYFNYLSDLRYAEHDGSSWNIDIVESVGGVGKYTSLELDGNDNPRISYYDATNSALKYASRSSYGWNRETVDSDGDVGWYTSLALDGSGNPRISYMDKSNYDLKYAAKTGSTWSLETVDSDGRVGYYTSIALDAEGRPRISYYRGMPEYDLKYAAYDGENWNIETVESEGEVGRYTSLALDTNGLPRISYNDATNGALKYAAYDGSNWNIEIVDNSADVGWYTSLRLDGDGAPRISYSDNTNGALRYASYNGTSWDIHFVDGTNWVGNYTSLALTANGGPRISYQRNNFQHLRYARMDSATTTTSTTSTTSTSTTSTTTSSTSSTTSTTTSTSSTSTSTTTSTTTTTTLPPENTYYIDGANGSDAYDGKGPNYNGESGPWKTISHATSQLGNGDTCWVRDGEYLEMVDGVANDGITLIGDCQGEIWPDSLARPVIDGENARDYGILCDKSNWVFRNLEIRNATVNNLHFLGSGSNNEARNIISHDAVRAGIYCDSGSTGNLIIGCESYNNQCGIRIHSNNGQTSSATVRGCIVRENSASGIYGCHLVSPASEVLVESCLVYDNNEGISGDWVILLVSDSTIAGNAGYGIKAVQSAAIGDLLNCIVTGSAVGIYQAGGGIFADYINMWDNEDNWAGAAIPGANCFSGNPLLADPESGDYRLTASSPCIDTGTDVDVYEDFEGDLRPIDGDGSGSAEHDVGADEYKKGPIVSADLEPDGDVDAADLSILISEDNWGKANPDNARANINGQGVVDESDLGIMMGCWNPS